MDTGLSDYQDLTYARLKARSEEISLHFRHFRDLIEISRGNNLMTQTFHPKPDLDEIIKLVQVNHEIDITLFVKQDIPVTL